MSTHSTRPVAAAERDGTLLVSERVGPLAVDRAQASRS